ncbi:SufD family Fe-S cluster assembly protein [Dethiosulfovibrio sp. F2B]|uniref:SufB/SufD family protein n=1 Tax=Dethiosulfovibrio faecalis TaxID=2720018 RepID=UPI001F18FC9F|nr:SufD family Fe-S cluster assembly protein [Dethiosulfovibrio faecalis]MCF4152656.1 SufD family Fe-S cluster assembly protein [Dethiosulfovibrio faecalis]
MDIDRKAYGHRAPERPELARLADLPEEDKATLVRSGIDPDAQVSGSFMLTDSSTVHCDCSDPNVEVLPMQTAMDLHDGLKEYSWNLMEKESDQVDGGYFIRSRPGATVTYPLQTCLYLAEDRSAQDVHNIVIAEEGSTLNILSGCASAPGVRSGLHVGISEIYVKKGATLSFTMVHNWAEEMAVRPKTKVMVEEGGTFISNYICLKPAKDLVMYPTAILNGEGAVATFNSVFLATPGSTIDSGSRVILKAPDTRAEVVSRAVSMGGKIYARGHLVGEVPGVKAHLECDGLILSDSGLIHAIPELEARCNDLEMSHEAAVGKIAQEEIEYLMARGLSEEDARSLIIKGFLSLDIMGLPDELKRDMEETIRKAGSEGAM